MHHGQLDVVIPCHNYGSYVHHAVASALAQEGFETRVIVVDDGSTDNTAEALAEFRDSPVTIIRLDIARGAANARNVGAAMSAGEFLAFLDADDLWPPTRSSVLAGLLGSVNQLACGAVQEFSVNDGGHVVRSGAVRAGTSLGAMLMRRATFESVGELDTSYSVGENIDWLSRARALGVELIANDSIALWRRVHRTNTTRASKKSDYLKAVRAHRARLAES